MAFSRLASLGTGLRRLATEAAPISEHLPKRLSSLLRGPVNVITPDAYVKVSLKETSSKCALVAFERRSRHRDDLAADVSGITPCTVFSFKNGKVDEATETTVEISSEGLCIVYNDTPCKETTADKTQKLFDLFNS